MENIPRQTVLCIILCASIILAFLALAVYPEQRSLADLKQQVKAMENQRKEQKMLLPLYENLSRSARFKRPEALPMPGKGAIALHETEGLSSVFGGIARKSRLTLLDAIPDIQSLGQDSHSLSVNLLLKGNFSDLRGFLLALGRIPALQDVEEIRIKSADMAQDMMVRVSLAFKR